jgi:hypothetical protein
MPPRKLKIALQVACTLFIGVALSHALDNGRLTEEFHQTYPFAANGRVSLSNINGPVHITAWDRNEVKLDAIKRANNQGASGRSKESGYSPAATTFPFVPSTLSGTSHSGTIPGTIRLASSTR